METFDIILLIGTISIVRDSSLNSIQGLFQLHDKMSVNISLIETRSHCSMLKHIYHCTV